MRYLLLSNSTLPGEPFLGWPEVHLRTFLGPEVRRVLFVPFAAVRLSYDEYAAMVGERLTAWGYQMDRLDTAPDPSAAVASAEAILVGGGNTFRLIDLLHRRGVVTAIRQRVYAGAPFVGWSAGANIASPTMRTTNDMPIVEPPTFDALGLVPFQINPHFTDQHPPGLGGETRADRLLEFVALNPNVPVLGLPEGTGVEGADGRLRALGTRAPVLFRAHEPPTTLAPGGDLTFLLDTPA